VSQKYAQEIQTDEFGSGLEGVIRARSGRLYGILNGVDYSEWSPETDSLIKANYSPNDLERKALCKQDLLAAFGLPASDMGKPLIGIVSRFTDQKGFDLIADTAGELMKEDVVFVALGSGDQLYEQLFQALAERNPSRIAVKIAYDNALAHKIEAGADMFLMPSRYEPCGLNQIYSLRYGTVPIVRSTGGLDDTITGFDPSTGQGTGFKFQRYTGAALLDCVQQALAVFRQPKIWRGIQVSGMAKDFSWKTPAAAYVKLYEAARRSRISRAVLTSNA
jgi:starch synthase